MRYLKVIFLVQILIVLTALNQLQARILRVGYNGAPLTGVDYANLAAAQTGANAGDTIQVYGSVGSLNVTKKLVFIGFGFNLDIANTLQVNALDIPSSATLSFREGSESSVVEGLQVDINLYISNVTIQRCRGSISLYNNTAAINNIKVIACALTSMSMISSTGFPCTNFRMSNCIFSGSVSFYLPGSSGLIENCVGSNYTGGYVNLNDAGFLVKNCILSGYNTNSINTIFNNNIFDVAQPSVLPLGNNNLWGQPYLNIFDALGGTANAITTYVGNGAFNDRYCILKTGSPGINAGLDGTGAPTDCGIFGGELAYRYRISGIPAVPAIYKLTGSSATSGNPYNVTISVRSNN
ncbi:MAG: hypothetical protein ABW007_19675 [Chitinophagaceae bacterium]